MARASIRRFVPLYLKENCDAKDGILRAAEDCPGLNAVIRAWWKNARKRYLVNGFTAGWRGALTGEGRWLSLRMWKAADEGRHHTGKLAQNIMKEENGSSESLHDECAWLEGLVPLAATIRSRG